LVLFYLGPLVAKNSKIWCPKQEKSCLVVVNLQSDLDKNITLLKDKEQELDKAIERLSSEEEIDVDDAVTTTAATVQTVSGLCAAFVLVFQGRVSGC
jgi:hypothetical protein